MKSKLETTVIYLATAIALLSILLLFILVSALALPVLFSDGDFSPFTWIWAPNQHQFGILPMLFGSLALSISALLIAFPFALAIACWLLAIGQGRLHRLVQAIIYFMAAIPTVVYGFVAIFLLTPIIRKAIGGSGFCWLSAAIMLAVLILPTLVMVLKTGLQTRLALLCPGGLAIGFSKLELLWTFVLPKAKSLLFSAALLGFGRAIGDTLIPLMLAGNAPQVAYHLSDSLRTLSAHMALVTANEVGGQAYNSLFAAGFLLLFINALISVIARRLTSMTIFKRSNKNSGLRS